MWHYFAAMEMLARPLMHGFAMALGLKANFFDGAHRDPMSVLKLNHYPPQEIIDETEIIGVGGHCDGGSFTILWQDSLGGLEVRNESGHWVGIPPIDGTFVINIANLLQRWTNADSRPPNIGSSTGTVRIDTLSRSLYIRPTPPLSSRSWIRRAARSSRWSAARTR